jgi:dipeptidyl aminopeptidase/acylaminoacyl peptidase
VGTDAKLIAGAAVVLVAAIVASPFLAARLGPTTGRAAAAPPTGPAGNGGIAAAKAGDILVAVRPGGELRPLVTGPEHDSDPMFSPDGTKLAFVRQTEQGETALMLADADGTGIVQVTSEPLGQLRFAPDGRSLIGMVPSDVATSWDFRLRSVDAAAESIVLETRVHDGAMAVWEWGGPEFRPTNAQEILIVGTLEPDGPRGIYVYDLPTNAVRTVLEPAGYVHDVVWTPDGRFISYDVTDETSIQSRVVAVDGSGDRPLLDVPGTDRYHRIGRWSNDGRRTVIDSGLGEVVSVVSTGGDGDAVELACGDIGCPGSWTWSPDDSMLVGTLPPDDSGEGGTSRVTTLLADPASGEVTELDWDVDLNDPQQWQRVAP